MKRVTVLLSIMMLLYSFSPLPNAYAMEVIIVTEHFTFTPALVTIMAGDTITWTNMVFPHSTTSGTACTPDGTWSFFPTQGSTYSRKFTVTGTYPYFCDFHCFNGMTGTIIVTADTETPLVTDFTLPAASDALIVPILSLSATDNVGVTGYLISESSSAPPAAAPGWDANPPTGYIFATEGIKTLFAWAKDAAGNISPGKSATVSITINHKGDINSDNIVNLQDAILLLQLFNGFTPTINYTTYVASGADVNGDNKMGMAEVIYVLQKISGIR